MKWNKTDYPASMKNLTEPEREKAIEIANELMEKTSLGQRIAVSTGIKMALLWAAKQRLLTLSIHQLQ